MATNEMLKAMCASVIEPRPSGTTPVEVNHNRSMTAIVTSGMMTGRYNNPSKAPRPTHRR